MSFEITVDGVTYDSSPDFTKLDVEVWTDGFHIYIEKPGEPGFKEGDIDSEEKVVMNDCISVAISLKLLGDNPSMLPLIYLMKMAKNKKDTP